MITRGKYARDCETKYGRKIETKRILRRPTQTLIHQTLVMCKYVLYIRSTQRQKVVYLV